LKHFHLGWVGLPNLSVNEFGNCVQLATRSAAIHIFCARSGSIGLVVAVAAAGTTDSFRGAELRRAMSNEPTIR
jgi:hypothetical protein